MTIWRINHLLTLIAVDDDVSPLSHLTPQLIHLASQSGSVSVSPSLCPTNKIAPRRRVASQARPRTFGYVAQLFSDEDLYPGAGGLQEPQPDGDDCGDIDDYDESDLSSLTPNPNTQRKRGYSDAENRLFFHNFFQRPPGAGGQQPNPGNPHRPSTRPPPGQPTPTRPPLFTKPPYYSGGIFGENQYRPPYLQNSSNNVKPVYEDTAEPPSSVTYRPSIVGGQLNHVVGVSPVRPRTQPTLRPDYQTTRPFPGRYDANSDLYYRPRPQQQAQTTPRPYPVRYNTNSVYPTRMARPRQMSDGIIGSFLDLLLK